MFIFTNAQLRVLDDLENGKKIKENLWVLWGKYSDVKGNPKIYKSLLHMNKRSSPRISVIAM